MSEDTTRNFLEVIGSFHWPDPKPITYRLYHDPDGKPILYTMEDLPGTYIEIDQETYTLGSHNVVVRDKRLVVLEPKVYVSKLKSNADSGTPCDYRDVCVIVTPVKPHIKWKKQVDEIS